MNNGQLVNDSGAYQEFGDEEQEPSQTNRQRESQTNVENRENEVQKEIESKEERPKCYICEENEADVAFKPCGHTVVCTGNQKKTLETFLESWGLGPPMQGKPCLAGL